jgi:nucleoside-diphosphate-sugar epimerase
MHEAKLNDNPTVEIWGSGKPRREFLYSDDMAVLNFKFDPWHYTRGLSILNIIQSLCFILIKYSFNTVIQFNFQP